MTLYQGAILWYMATKFPETRSDAWVNPLSGIGTTRDKSIAGFFTPDCRLSDYELDAMYYGEDLAAKIVDKRPDEAFRKGYSIELNKDKEAGADLQKDAKAKLNLDEQIQDAWRWGRLWGGTLAVLGVNDGQKMDQPVNEDRIQGIDFINVIDRRFVRIAEYFNDPLAPNFGQPSVYEITAIGDGGLTLSSQRAVSRVHADRCIRFDGIKTDKKKSRELAGWSYSILQRTYAILRGYGVSISSMGLMLSEASQGVFKIQNLIGMIAGGQKEKLQDRMAAVDMSKSVVRSILVDADREDYKREPMSFAGVSDVADRLAQRLAAAFDMPLTVLMGTSPAGLNATGASDLELWYNSIASDQEKILMPALMKVYRYLALAAGTKVEEIEICWRPLKEISDKERAELYKATADADKVMIDAGVVQPEEVALARFGSGRYTPHAAIVVNVDELTKALKPTEFETPAGDLLTPSDLASAVTVNEARANKGLGPLLLEGGGEDPDGSLTVAEFKAKKEALGSTNGTNEADPGPAQGEDPNAEGGQGPAQGGTPVPAGSAKSKQGNAPNLPSVPVKGNPAGRKQKTSNGK